jgi:tRNA(adenine34) deaminase
MIRGMTAPSFMDLALKTAKNAAKAGEVPIGCVIVRGYEVIATAGNRTLTDRDPTAHAEILAIRQAAEAIGTERLVDCDLYVTLEPCTMCAGAAVLSRVDRLVFGAYDEKAGAVGSLWDVVRDRRLNHRPEVVGGVLADESAALLQAFFSDHR